MIARNVEGLDRIHLHRFALGATEGTLEIRPSDSDRSLGGFSFYDAGTAKVPGQKVPVRTPRSVIGSGTAPAPDLIKIDAEGAEYDILTAFDPGALARVRWITGELHGNRSFELLEFLSQWFDIDAKKTLGKRLFNFSAKNRSA
jgi:FkbM family methyltransferase